MDFVSIFGIGVALAMDAAAVSVSCGSSDKNCTKSYAVMTALTFGAFQTFMPVLGWSIGKVGKNFASGCEYWIAFVILAFLGAKMIYDSFHREEADFSYVQKRTLRMLVIMAFATSIDALTAGIILPTAVCADTPLSMFIAVSVIGIITFMLSLGGFYIGKIFRAASPKAAEIFGGAVLILIGIKTLIGSFV